VLTGAPRIGVDFLTVARQAHGNAPASEKSSAADIPVAMQAWNYDPTVRQLHCSLSANSLHSTDAKLLHEAFTVTPLLITLLIVAGIALLIVIGYLNNVVENNKLERAGSKIELADRLRRCGKSPRPSPASS
jgi:hypothetical protein